jgi:hypothetical protein
MTGFRRSQLGRVFAITPFMRKNTETTAEAGDRLEQAYMPTQTSLRAPFRSNGDDRQRDQEFAGWDGGNRWNDEDRFTNKSGDPRIGTHGRTYEPAESRAAKES